MGGLSDEAPETAFSLLAIKFVFSKTALGGGGVKKPIAKPALLTKERQRCDEALNVGAVECSHLFTSGGRVACSRGQKVSVVRATQHARFSVHVDILHL